MPTPSNDKNENFNVSPAAPSGEPSRSSGRPGSVNEALRMLDQALSRDGANLKDLVSSEYVSLRKAIEEMAPKMGEAFRQYGHQAADVIQDYAGQGIERGKRVAGQVDTTVRENPWPVIGGVAIGSLAVGFILGRSGSSPSESFH